MTRMQPCPNSACPIRLQCPHGREHDEAGSCKYALNVCGVHPGYCEPVQVVKKESKS